MSRSLFSKSERINKRRVTAAQRYEAWSRQAANHPDNVTARHRAEQRSATAEAARPSARAREPAGR